MATRSEGVQHTLNEELSKIAAVRTKAQSCWRNSFSALTSLPDLAGAEYIEGWVVTKGSHQIIEHGWLEKDGAVVDPTLPGQIEAYFAGLRFSAAQGLQVFDRAEGRLPLAWYLVNDLGDKEACAAYQEAFERAEACAGWKNAKDC
jgi:hypothetical protein